ncbi:MAG TPA: 50S ribosomal protein L31 [Candidatus Paceibacterota bacterium]
MKKDIHPTYHNKADIHCACGNKWITGSTMPELGVEICNNCHPFYTGKEKMLDARGRVDKFNKRLTKSEETIKGKVAKKPRSKKTK